MTFDGAARQLTKNQSLVFEALVSAEAPLSAYSILDRLRGDGVRAPLQVYRALDKLVEFGMIHRLESVNAFVACSHPHHGEQSHGIAGFAICKKCGQVCEFHDHEIAERLGQWVDARGFRPAKTTIEIRGLCKACC